MAEITAALVKELRERTGQGMMECKKALVAAEGDIEKAIDDMRASGDACQPCNACCKHCICETIWARASFKQS